MKDKVTCMQLETIKVKGIEKSTQTYQVIDTNDNLKGRCNHFQNESNGFILSLDLNIVDKKKVASALQLALNNIHEINEI